ncbi:MFS transporter [Bacillus benzoevorans]|uniref:Sugar phosphate permease n=1 Tax=Bacillus benzoevorans TaxID=1456 RepID=A0A7X0LW97_9BACI|nr:MFS transporter [Bacillus benzoevorans]MBB6446831.1 sugar phosphate permease [Bacillus benzoevorans]
MKKRNIILTLLFVTWTLSYMDRMVMTVAIPYISKDFDLTPVSMGIVMSAFFAGYALFQVPGGMLADKFGSRKTMVSAVTWWSLFTVATAMATSFTNMLIIRVLFGIGEASFPGGSWKTLSNWFPKKERATANGIMMSSNALGPAIAPLFVVGVMAAFGWRSVFLFLVIPGIIVAALLWWLVRDNPKDSKLVSAEELKVIQGDEGTKDSGKKMSFKDVVKQSMVWKLVLIWFTFDITFWGFSSWVPTYLINARGFDLVSMGINASLPFFAGTVGLILGGYLSDKFFVGRRRTLIIGSDILAAIFLYFTFTTGSMVPAMALLTLSGFFICMSFGAIWALPMNVLKPEVMGSSSALINFGGQVAGFISPIVIGFLIEAAGGSFNTAFYFLIAAVLVSAVITTSVREHENTKTAKLKIAK